ncbi:[protein release factor]-glutamine N5-methyltransferase [Hydrogenispora ethanolica]|uniref:Release factor glutamine methyltransferase n=1 Tax=Hydrogenispora ethanolica TaxID=1082276 RepID=A0A4R1RMD8_HYDET|nr:peptide chain release factor N(5)-glutamine methyltransferase [Hydrogenispora ethanolica]TCL67354.1 [protein release factor]-glutamine N5-methyltransferase [Hydrogenispora ethanolica]
MSTSNNLTIGAIIARTVPFLAEKHLPNPRLEADLMLAHVLDLPRVKLYSEWDRPLEPAEIQRYREILVQRVQGWPLAYLTGQKSFLSWDFKVTPAVLIPRPETELLVETVVDALKGRDGVCGADVGTGSGIIAIALAKLLPGSRWYALDLSAEALEVAAANAARLGVAERIEFRRGDLLEPLAGQGLALDAVVSNPPYIPTAVVDTLQPEVRREPRLALDGGPDGLDLYRRLLPAARELLKPDGLVALEHGADQRSGLAELLAGLEFLPEPLADLAGRDRVMLGRRRKAAGADA